jgi:FKBP-type peptidyl-prolyl cis-trans isomerase
MFKFTFALTAGAVVLAALGSTAAAEEAAASQPSTQPAEAAASAPAEEAAPTGLAAAPLAERFSYFIGFQVGEQMKSIGLTLVPAGFEKGLSASQAGNEPELSEEAVGAMMGELQQLATDMEAKDGLENLAKAEAFLEANKTAEGVITTESGLQYKVMVPGEGDSPSAESTVEVHYKGTLLDGTVFDSSYDRGETAEFAANRVIPGWTEALQLMKPGAKYKLFIHPKLAYGDRGQREIPANSLLVFEVELIAVK